MFQLSLNLITTLDMLIYQFKMHVRFYITTVYVRLIKSRQFAS